MADVLDTKLGLEFDRGADSPSFFVDEIAKEGLVKGIDLSNIRQLGREVIDFADLLRSTRTKPSEIQPMFRVGLIEAVEALKTALRGMDKGTLRIETNANSLINASNVRSLYDGFGDGDGLTIPVPAVTASNILAFQNIPDDFQPVADLRIKLPTSKPTAYFASPGQIDEIPSQGSWFRFRLVDTVFSNFE